MTYMPAADTSPPSASGGIRMTPGRWVALAVAVPVALALIGWTGFSLLTAVARGSYPFSYAVPVHNGQVAVNVNTGQVTLRQGPGRAARLIGTVQYGLIRPGISENPTPTGADLSINCDGIATDCGLATTLDVPARTAVTLWSDGSDIDVSGVSSDLTLSAQGGNLTASDLAGDLRLDTGGGDLTASGLTGTIQITTEGGNIDASNLDGTGTGTMRLDTGGGDLTGSGFTGNLQLFTEGGNIDASAVDSHQATIASGGGDVTLELTRPPASLQIISDGGNVTVILPPGNTKYDISTPDAQGANVSYPGALVNRTSPYAITVNSGGGDITIAHAS